MEIISSAMGSLTGPDFQVAIQSGNHYFLADEPAELLGGDTGPDPYSLVLSALSACTAITLKMYASRKEWALENVEVYCELIRSEPGKLPEIRRSIRLSGRLDSEQQQRLLQIANSCPVHKLLASGTSISSSLTL